MKRPKIDTFLYSVKQIQKMVALKGTLQVDSLASGEKSVNAILQPLLLHQGPSSPRRYF
jgi:hypothetical protein